MIRHFTCSAFSFKPVDQFLVDQVLVAEIFLNLLYLGDKTGLVKSWLFQFELNKIQVNPFRFLPKSAWFCRAGCRCWTEGLEEMDPGDDIIGNVLSFRKNEEI